MKRKCFFVRKFYFYNKIFLSSLGKKTNKQTKHTSFDMSCCNRTLKKEILAPPPTTDKVLRTFMKRTLYNYIKVINPVTIL